MQKEKISLHKPNEFGEHILLSESLKSTIMEDAKNKLTQDALLKYSEDDVEAILNARNTRNKAGTNTQVKPQEL